MNKAVELNLNTDGLLLISDGILIKFWKLSNYDPGVIWFVTDNKSEFEVKKNATNNEPNSLDQLQRMAILMNQSISNNLYFSAAEINILKSIYEKIDNNLLNYLTMTKNTFNAGSNCFYLPRSKFETFHFVSMIFRSFGLHAKVAVPYLIVGLDSDNSSQSLVGRYKWNNQLSVINDYLNYSAENSYFYPFKISLQQSRMKDQADELCRYYLKNKYDNF
jgi:hypothetical protein